MMGSGLVTLLVSMFARTESETVCPKSNQVIGTCDELRERIKKGVQDEKGDFHENAVGWTNSYWSSKYRWKPSSTQTVGDTICITVQRVRVQFYASSVRCKLTWTPRGLPWPLPANCRKAINAWHRATDIHETQHRSDAIRVAQRATENWEKISLSFTGCGSNPSAAQAALNAKIEAALAFQGKLIEQEAKFIGNKFDVQDRGDSDPCACALCNPMAAGQVCDNQCCDACSVCDINNICVSKCRGECTECKDGECVRTCKPEEYCCGVECINLSEKKCCTTSAGSFTCPSNWGCCMSGQCCAPNSECCPISIDSRDRVCIPYGNSNCGNCIRCGSGQECCIKANGVVAGCCEVGRCHPERGCT